MNEQKTAVLIRCCEVDYKDALELFDTLAAFTPDLYLVYAGETVPAEVQSRVADRLILLNAAFLNNAGLGPGRLSFTSYCWQCGDLALYAAYDRVQADYYWMIEPDVYASRDVFAKLFSAQLAADFYAPKLRREHERWHWYSGTRRYYEQVWACLFCVIAIRRSVLPELRQKRAQMIAAWCASNDLPRQMPNDEGFVASFMPAADHSSADLNELFRVYSKRSIGFGMPESRRCLALRGRARGLVHHPVCTGPSFEYKVRQRATAMGLWYGTAYDILVERETLPIAPVVDQITAVAYLFLVRPRAAWRRATLKLGGIRGIPGKVRRMLRQGQGQGQGHRPRRAEPPQMSQ